MSDPTHTVGFQTGRVAGLTQAQKTVRQIAADMFINGNDEMAEYLRTLASMLQDEIDDARKWACSPRPIRSAPPWTVKIMGVFEVHYEPESDLQVRHRPRDDVLAGWAMDTFSSKFLTEEGRKACLTTTWEMGIDAAEA